MQSIAVPSPEALLKMLAAMHPDANITVARRFTSMRVPVGGCSNNSVTVSACPALPSKSGLGNSGGSCGNSNINSNCKTLVPLYTNKSVGPCSSAPAASAPPPAASSTPVSKCTRNRTSAEQDALSALSRVRDEERARAESAKRETESRHALELLVQKGDHERSLTELQGRLDLANKSKETIQRMLRNKEAQLRAVRQQVEVAKKKQQQQQEGESPQPPVPKARSMSSQPQPQPQSSDAVDCESQTEGPALWKAQLAMRTLRNQQLQTSLTPPFALSRPLLFSRL